MEITRVDYRGFAGIPERGEGLLNSFLNFVDNNPDRQGRGFDKDRLKLRYKFNGPVSEDYQISTGLINEGRRAPDSEVSPCGGRAFLKIHNQAIVRSSSSGENALLTIDSIDGASNTIYHVNWRRCDRDDRDRDDKDKKDRDRRERDRR